ncbi:hypothetical protein XELAEV_18042119mg [Xenopus laevis]|uniref:Uncharacterized protein n=1 Tax=Xenopus laevis TaxID=8355 RepID=A0A974H5R6_XENLA|nr:hypothetical protein XELAEV_18042119mg [Xenopus laevis]
MAESSREPFVYSLTLLRILPLAFTHILALCVCMAAGWVTENITDCTAGCSLYRTVLQPAEAEHNVKQSQQANTMPKQ